MSTCSRTNACAACAQRLIETSLIETGLIERRLTGTRRPAPPGPTIQASDFEVVMNSSRL
jgi:hypothetical protein